MPVETQPRPAIPITPAVRAAVAKQLELILSSPLFRQSKRYSPFLRYVVEKTLAGESETLKERTLGVEIFGRPPDYDSSNDPIVRVTAGEVRKRIAQYYHESGHDRELRIDLSPGSYVPEFFPAAMHYPEAPPVRASYDEVDLRRMAPAEMDPARKNPTPVGKRVGWILAVTVAALSVLAYLIHWQTQKPGVVDQWWQPALRSPSPVLLSVGTIDPKSVLSETLVPESRLATDADTVEGNIHKSDQVGLVDAIALETFASLFSTRKHGYRTLAGFRTTYNDLRASPVVLIAGLDNPWTLRVTEPLRFHFAVQPGTKSPFIADVQHPENVDWHVDFSSPYSQMTKDYAIIARLHDATSDKPIFVAAGIGRNGTAAAVEYMTSDSTLQTLIGQLPAHWEEKNIEAVIQTRVINGQAGPPILVSVQTW